MRNLIKVSLIGILISITFTNCSKDKIKGCTDPTATNYNSSAEENDGSCIYDPCKSITCLNGGTCNNGVCQCPQGFTGSTCATQITPTAIFLSKITVTNFCQSCDPDEPYPDIYVVLKKGATTLLSSTNFTDATSPGNYVFTLSSSLNLSPTELYDMELWDKDSFSGDDMIDFAFFFPYDGTGGFPNPIVVTYSTFSFKLDVNYSW